MTTSTAETKDATTAMFIFAAAIVVVVGLATFIWGLGALIVSGVIATWAILAFLVLMTAGG